jgi:hypothetical protein
VTRRDTRAITRANTTWRTSVKNVAPIRAAPYETSSATGRSAAVGLSAS